MNHLTVLSVSEGKDVFTRRMIAVGADRVKVFATLESSASLCAGAMELWHGLSQIVRDQQRGRAAGPLAGPIGGHGAATLTGMVLRCGRQEGRAAARAGG